MAKINLIKRSDYDRVLITETLPYETPIIFSNDGLYDCIKGQSEASPFQKSLVDALILGKGPSLATTCTQPYLYKIRKNSLEYRRLALLHPISQWKIREFYRRYEKLILHYCSHSPASIRAPKSIASTFYSKNSWENVYKYKTGAVALESLDGYAKHTPSFFSYRGCDRLYKFFTSVDYFQLEKRFQSQMTLDVSKCFDSIYTHSIVWATKEKEFIKKNLRAGSFGDEFDVVIRHGNHNETNGIPIGPEVSRIFSEIIFQEIDRITIDNLKDLKFDVDYVFRRYVDDVYIFARDESITKQIYSTYSDSLMSFNLHANAAKATTQNRPFVTKKSRLIFGASDCVNIFFESFLQDEGRGVLIPKPIYSPWRLAKKFIDSIKVLCSQSDVDYDEIASFLISSITERIKRLVNSDISEMEKEVKRGYVSAIDVMFEVLFFLYSVSPSVSASYKVSTSIILSLRFTQVHLKNYEEEVSHKLYELILNLLVDECRRLRKNTVSGFVHLEFLNILLAARELGSDFLIPESIILDLFVKDKKLTYFTISSCLFYIKDDAQYNAVRKMILTSVKKQLSNMSDIFISSEKAHLLLDLIGCPYVPKKNRQQWIKAICLRLELPALDPIGLGDVTEQLSKEHWQVNWADVDLLNSLEKKELKQAY